MSTIETSLKLFSDKPLVQEINREKQYLHLLQDELDLRKEYAAEEKAAESFVSRIEHINNKKAILLIESEIEAKTSFVRELELKLLNDKDVIEQEYPQYKKERPKFFDKLNEIGNSGYKTPFHKVHFTSLRSYLSEYEKSLALMEQDKHNIKSTTGIKEGVLHYYTLLVYAIDDH